VFVVAGFAHIYVGFELPLDGYMADYIWRCWWQIICATVEQELKKLGDTRGKRVRMWPRWRWLSLQLAKMDNGVLLFPAVYLSNASSYLCISLIDHQSMAFFLAIRIYKSILYSCLVLDWHPWPLQMIVNVFYLSYYTISQWSNT